MKRRLAGRLTSLLLLGLLALGCGTSGGYDEDGPDNGHDPCEGVVEGYPCGPYGHSLNDTVMDCTFYDPDTGDPVSFSDFVADKTEKRANKVFIVNSLAQWCSACRAESPEIYDVYTEFRERGVELIMTINQAGMTISDIDESPQAIREAATWWRESVIPASAGDEQFLGVLADTSKCLNQFYDISATPLNIILSPQFKIEYKATGWDGKSAFSDMLDAIVRLDLEQD